MTAPLPGSLWGEVAGCAGLRVHRILAADERWVTLVEVRTAAGSPAPREKRTRLPVSRLLRSYAPIGDVGPTRTRAALEGLDP